MRKLIFSFIFSFIAQVGYSQISQSNIDAAFLLNGLKPSDFTYIITSQYTSSTNGITHVYLRQTINQTEIFNANSSMHFNKSGQLVSFQNAFINKAATLIYEMQNTISYYDAIDKVAASLNLKINYSSNKTNSKNNEIVITDKQASRKDIKAKKYYLFLNSQLIPVWNVEVYDDKKGDWWNKRVNANNANIIEENNWTTYCNVFKTKQRLLKPDACLFNFEDAPEHLKKVNTGTYKVVPFPFESTQKSPRILVTNPASAKASPFGWHDVDGVIGAEYNITRGNNVYAKEDTLAADSTYGFAPDGGSSLVFDYPMDSSAYPRKYLSAAITNLFYWNNIIHDVYVNYGFDEAAGNFQETNYTGQGDGFDFVYADAQDGSGTNNANFSTPPDGNNPRMQMYIWQASGSDKLFNVLSPDSLKGQYISAAGSFGPTLTKTGVSGSLTIGYDATADSNLCCENLITNLSGKIALIDRGSCFFVNKVYNAQLAGAKAAIIINNTPGAPFSMGSGGNGIDTMIHIPSIMITQQLGEQLKSALLANTAITVLIADSSNGPVYFDSDMDNGVMIHEYTHGLSNRLTGGPQNTNCLINAEQGGEGWSDFFALALTARESDKLLKGRGMGTYLIGEDTNGVGIRDYPYSKDLSVNPSTYDDIKTNPEVHFVGFVWCTMLYDIFLDMVEKYGFNKDVYNGKGGNNMTIQLVMDGLKLQPCTPGFVDARNAILLADSINNHFDNYDLLWKAFARRGLGFYANQGSANSVTDGMENFDLPPAKPNALHEVLKSEDITMFPNPTNANVNIIIQHLYANIQVTVIDLMGNVILMKHYNTGEQINLNLNNASNGVYLVQITSEQGTVCKKLFLNK